MHHVVPRLLGTPGAIRSPAPRLGQHNRELLAELGFGSEKYREMASAGIVVEGAAEARSEEE
jgi:formyl-CoA transferase